MYPLTQCERPKGKCAGEEREGKIETETFNVKRAPRINLQKASKGKSNFVKHFCPMVQVAAVVSRRRAFMAVGFGALAWRTTRPPSD